MVGKGSREGSLKPADSLTPSGPLPTFTKILQDECCRIGDTLRLSCQGITFAISFSLICFFFYQSYPVMTIISYSNYHISFLHFLLGFKDRKIHTYSYIYVNLLFSYSILNKRCD